MENFKFPRRLWTLIGLFNYKLRPQCQYTRGCDILELVSQMVVWYVGMCEPNYGVRVYDVMAPVFWRWCLSSDVLALTFWWPRFGADVLAPTFWRRSFGSETFWRKMFRRRYVLALDILAPNFLTLRLFGAKHIFHWDIRLSDTFALIPQVKM